MQLRDLLLLGHPSLYEVAEPVQKQEVGQLAPLIRGLHSVLMEFREKYGAGRAVAAPQMGVMKRLIYMHIDRPVVFINPVLYDLSDEMMELWDDCMSFPHLLVRLRRHKSCKIRFWDEHWQEHIWELHDDLSELLQHEYDHLNGILATQRAIDARSFRWRSV